MARINRGKQSKIYKSTQINFEEDATFKQIRAANQKALQILDARVGNYPLVKEGFLVFLEPEKRERWEVKSRNLNEGICIENLISL